MKCKHRKECKWYSRTSATCNTTGGGYYEGGKPAGCYVTMEKKSRSSDDMSAAKMALTVLTVGAIGFMFVFFLIATTMATDASSVFQKARAITLSGNSSTLSSHQVAVNFTWDTDIGDPEYVCFYSNDNATTYDYWVQEYVDSEFVYYWVETNEDFIWIYYSNTTTDACQGSNGTATFLAFDDFNDGSMTWDATGGNAFASITESGGLLKLTHDASNGHDNILQWNESINESDIAVTAEMYQYTPDGDVWTPGLLVSWDGIYEVAADMQAYNGIMGGSWSNVRDMRIMTFNDGSGAFTNTTTPGDSVQNGTWYIGTMRRIAGNFYYSQNVTATDVYTQNTSKQDNYTGLVLEYNAGNQGWFDWWFTRKAMIEEPTASVGDEITISGGDTTPPTMTIQNPLNGTDESTSIININITVNEDADWCAYNFDGGTNYTMNNDSMTNWYIVNQSSISNGTTVNLEIYCNDTTGNLGLNNTLYFTYADQVYADQTMNWTITSSADWNLGTIDSNSFVYDGNLTINHSLTFTILDAITSSEPYGCAAITGWHEVDNETYLIVYQGPSATSQYSTEKIYYYSSNDTFSDNTTIAGPGDGDNAYPIEHTHPRIDTINDQLFVLYAGFDNAQSPGSDHAYFHVRNSTDNGVTWDDYTSIIEGTKYDAESSMAITINDSDEWICGRYADSDDDEMIKLYVIHDGYIGLDMYNETIHNFATNDQISEATAIWNGTDFFCYYRAGAPSSGDLAYYYGTPESGWTSGSTGLGTIDENAHVYYEDGYYWWVYRTGTASTKVGYGSSASSGTYLQTIDSDAQGVFLNPDPNNRYHYWMSAGKQSSLVIKMFELQRNITGNATYITAVNDTGQNNTDWNYVYWHVDDPDNTETKVYISVTNDTDSWPAWSQVTNNTDQGLTGRYGKLLVNMNNTLGTTSYESPTMEGLFIQTSQGDDSSPVLTFVDVTQPNGTTNDTEWFFVNVSLTENASCFLDVNPTVSASELGNDNFEIELAANTTTWSSDNEHANIGNVCLNASSEPCPPGESGNYNITIHRAFDYYNLSGITANVTNATYQFGIDDESISDYNDLSWNFSVYYLTSFNYNYSYCSVNDTRRSFCWYDLNDTTGVLVGYVEDADPQPNDEYSLDVTDIINEELSINGGDSEIVFLTMADNEYLANYELVSQTEWSGGNPIACNVTYTSKVYENETMTSVNDSSSSYCYLNATFDLTPTNGTEFTYKVWAFDANDNLGSSSGFMSWIYGVMDASITCTSCASCSSSIQDATAGQTVSLTSDITDATTTCIDFGGNDGITFDCQGYTISSTNGVGDGIKIYGSDNSTIMGCSNISYFNNAIHSVTGNTSSNITIYNTSIYQTSGTGIVIVGSNNNLTDILIFSSGNAGMTFGAGNSNAFTRVNSSYSTGYGLHFSTSSNNTIEDCDFISNGDDGIYFQASDGNVMNNSNVSGTSGSGEYNLEIAGEYNNFTNNHIKGDNAIRISANYNNSIFINNNITGTNSIDSTSRNTFNTTYSASTNVLGYTGYGGNYWSSYSGNDYDGDGIGDDSYSAGTNNIDYLPLILPDFTTVSVTTPDGDQNWSFSDIAGGEELLDLHFTSTANSLNTIFFTLGEDLANTTLVSINSSTNLTLDDDGYATFNISVDASCPAGSYSGNLTWTSANDSTQTGNITIYFDVSTQSGNVNIIGTTWSLSKDTSTNGIVSFTINNSGNYNLTHCNCSFTNVLGATSSFDQSDFTVSNTTNVVVAMTVSGGSAGTDASSRFDVSCQATPTGGTDSDSLIGTLTVTAGGGGGGGGGDTTTIIESNVTLGYVAGDGLCQSVAGENAFNSEDCRLDISQNNIQLAVVILVLILLGYVVLRYRKPKIKKSKYRFDI